MKKTTSQISIKRQVSLNQQPWHSNSNIPFNQPKLWTLGKIKNSGSLLWEAKIRQDNQDQTQKQIQIYDSGILQIVKLQNNQIHQKHFKFQFQLLTDINVQQLTVQFIKDDQKIKYKLLDFPEIIAWKNILKNKLNQRGFHQKFKPLKKLGKGTFATVFSALKYQDNNVYAVKAFHKQATYSQQNGKQTIKKQLQIMRQLKNKYLMKLYQVYQSDNSLYMILQYLQGNSLQQKFREEYQFKQEQTRNIIKCLLQGLKEMHSLNIMHRDFKPDNLLFRIPEFQENQKKNLNWSKEIVIADFGLAQFCYSQQYLYVRCGTPGYVAPQVINIKDFTQKYTYACDLYSLGLILHVMLTNKTLFPGNTYEEVLKQNRNYEYKIQKNGIYKNLAQEAVDLLAKLLEKNPQKRITAVDALSHPYILGQKFPKKGFSLISLFRWMRGDKNKKNDQFDPESSFGKVKNQQKMTKSKKIVFHQQDQICQNMDEQNDSNNHETSQIGKQQIVKFQQEQQNIQQNDIKDIIKKHQDIIIANCQPSFDHIKYFTGLLSQYF